MSMTVHPVHVLTLCAALAATGTASFAQQPVAAPAAERTIRVSGFGEVQVRPDEAHLDFAVETLAPTARAASDENARTMNRVIAALVAAGVPRQDIQTQGFSVFPDYGRGDPRDTIPRIRGYRVNNTVSVRTGALNRVGAFIDAALGAGANRVNGVRFGVRKTDPVQAEALRRATARARAQAEIMAAALGVRLGPVLDASTSAQPRPYPVMMQARGGVAEMDASVAPPIEPGDQTVTAMVSLVFAIAGTR
ncbi:SIMPL domain-containing protein [soil metagenome]